jgi:hypothetical protein
MLRAAAFNGGEAALVMDDVDGMALQCQGRREKVRGESIWTERERPVVLTDNGGRRRCSDRNQRGGGVSSGGSRRGGCVGGGEGGELELGRGCGTKRSEAPVSSPNQRARGESIEGNGGGGVGLVPRGGRKTGERGGLGLDTATRTVGSGWLQVAWSEAATRSRGGDGLANRGGQRGMGDAVRRG